MSSRVMAVFSGTELDEGVFAKALEVASQQGAPLLLLDVRHRQRAEQLGHILSDSSFLGPKTIRDLKKSVKAQRSEAIRRVLESMESRAAQAGVSAQSHVVKGDYAESVRQVSQEFGVEVIVASKGKVLELAGLGPVVISA